MKFGDIEILNNICKKKLDRLNKLGVSLGYDLPDKRTSDIVKPNISTDNPMIIAEIKRSSPTQGNIGKIENPLELARKYIQQGANAISVLCEEDYFKGSIMDLYHVKSAFPNICVLRKDFILTKDEVEISHRIGADMILLIVSVFKDNMESFMQIYEEILSYNLTPLIEIHDMYEYSLVSHLDFSRSVLGINSRNLKTFTINKANALKMRAEIPNHIPVIFESGLDSQYEAFVVGNGGFSGILCGSTLVRNMESGNANKLKEIRESFQVGIKSNQFFYRLCRKYKKYKNKPLVKICGINNHDFMREALKYADLLGFIIEKSSSRYVSSDFCKSAAHEIESLDNAPLRVGVVTKHCFDDGLAMLRDGIFDALQLHDFPLDFFSKDSNLIYGDLEICMNDLLFPFYPSLKELNASGYNQFFYLYDKSGGNSESFDINLVRDMQEEHEILKGNLWLAGGICLDNIDAILSLNPMLIDINSGLESTKGVKSIEKLNEFFRVFKG